MRKVTALHRPRPIRVFALFAITPVLLVAANPPARADDPPVSVLVTEKRLLLIPPDHQHPIGNDGSPADGFSVTVSRDGSAAAYAASKDGRNFVVIGDRKGPDLDGEVVVLIVSDRGDTVTYVVAGKDDRYSLWVNHARLGDEAATITTTGPRLAIEFSPDRSRVAAVMKQADKQYVVVDGRKGPEFDGVFMPAFSPDGKRFAYVGSTGIASQFAVIDGKVGPRFVRVERPVFSPDGARVAYPAGGVMILDDVPGPKVDLVAEPVFSPDSKRLAYLASHNGLYGVIVDGKPGPGVNRVTDIRFSPDSKHIAYLAEFDQRKLALVDHQVVGQDYDEIEDLRFSPDSSRYVFLAEKDGEVFIVENGKPGPHFDEISSHYLAFSPDGKRIAYWASQGENSFIVTDGKKGPEHPGAVSFEPRFNPDGSKVAYTVHHGPLGRGKGFVVVNNRSGPEFDAVGDPVFSPDSRSIAYVAQRGGKQVVVLNDQPGPECDAARNLAFGADSTKLVYVAHLGREVWRKVVDVPQ